MSLIRYEPDMMPRSAFDSGLSPFKCGNCWKHVTKQNESDSAIWLDTPMMKCNNCGEAPGSISVLPSNVPLMDADHAKDIDWYHATCVDDWYQKVSTGNGIKKGKGECLYLHVGTEEASRDIADQKYFKRPEPGETISLYRIRLKKEAVLAPHMVGDHETWEGFQYVTKQSKKELGADAVRYVNRWEAPGSISLLVDARSIEFLSVKQIFAR